MDNPFRIPQEINTNLIKLRKEESQRRRTEKLIERRSIKLASRGSKSKKTNDELVSKAQNSTEAHVTPKKSQKIDAMYKENHVLARNSPDGRMSIKEFVSKKREMLLLNMKIDTQYENIDKLHRQLKEREDALQAKEASLTESMQSFDEFLKETDEKARNAQRQAEKEMVRRMKKEQDVNELQNQLKAVQSQISKQRDTLEEYERCKQFIDSITPPSWFDECAAAKRKRQQQRRRDRIKARQEAFRQEQQKILDEKKKEEENKVKWSSSSIRRTRKGVAENQDRESITVPDFDDEPLTSSDEEYPMYFENPDQVKKRLIELESENASILQNTNQGEDILCDTKLI